MGKRCTKWIFAGKLCYFVKVSWKLGNNFCRLSNLFCASVAKVDEENIVVEALPRILSRIDLYACVIQYQLILYWVRSYLHVILGWKGDHQFCRKFLYRWINRIFSQKVRKFRSQNHLWYGNKEHTNFLQSDGYIYIYIMKKLIYLLFLIIFSFDI